MLSHRNIFFPSQRIFKYRSREDLLVTSLAVLLQIIEKAVSTFHVEGVIGVLRGPSIEIDRLKTRFKTAQRLSSHPVKPHRQPTDRAVVIAYTNTLLLLVLKLRHPPRTLQLLGALSFSAFSSSEFSAQLASPTLSVLSEERKIGFRSISWSSVTAKLIPKSFVDSRHSHDHELHWDLFSATAFSFIRQKDRELRAGKLAACPLSQ